MRVAMINTLARTALDNRGAEGRIQCFTEPHADLMWGDGEHRVFRGVRSEQDGVCLACAGQEKCQA